ncbi:ribosomal protein L14E (/ type) [Clostridia bacterium]|nr:ribosomal protein L14E (/ type) [Clostridia bacterium]
MEITKGQIVRSVAGHDKGSFFVVTELQEPYAFICDGKRRPVERQKRKKIKHLSLTKTVVDIGSNMTNREIRRTLRLFKENSMAPMSNHEEVK